MFVMSKTTARVARKTGLVLSALMVTTFSYGVPALAGSGHSNDGTIPVTVTIDNVRAGDMPLYISVQKRGQYQGIKGYGTILKSTTNGTMTATIKVDVVDDYAVSLWHDLDDDGVFSMNEQYRPEDGWGASGKMPTNRAPTFDDVKISVPVAGKAVRVRMIYPS